MEKIKELLRQVTSTPKWYAIREDGQSTLRYTAMRIRQGKCKIETIREFFRMFGYEIEIDLKVNKVN